MQRQMNDMPQYSYRTVRYGGHGMVPVYNGQPIQSGNNSTSELDTDDSFLTKDYLDSISDEQLDDTFQIPK